MKKSILEQEVACQDWKRQLAKTKVYCFNYEGRTKRSVKETMEEEVAEGNKPT